MNYDDDMKICNAATDGPWKQGDGYVLGDPNYIYGEDGLPLARADNDNDLEYFKRFNPVYVRQLIEKAQRVDELEEFARRVADQKFQGGITAVMAIAAEELLK